VTQSEPSWLPPIIGESSALYSLPLNLPPENLAWWEVFKFTVESIDLAYRRVVAALQSIPWEYNGEDNGAVVGRAHIDAWAMVDAVWRLADEVLQRRPTGTVKRDPSHPQAGALKKFSESAKDARGLRNMLHHPTTDSHAIAAARAGESSLGEVHWTATLPTQDWAARVMIPTPPRGEFKGKRALLKGPREHPIDGVYLLWHGIECSLTDRHASTRELVSAVDSQLAPQAVGRPSGLPGLVLTFATVHTHAIRESKPRSK